MDKTQMRQEIDALRAVLASARSRIEELEEVLQDIAYYDMTDGEKLKNPIDVVDSLCVIARQALSGKSEPVEPKEVSVEELAKGIRGKADEWCSLQNNDTSDSECESYIAAHLLTKYTIKEKV